ncbi:hypothetical protein RvY_02957 [Ramazzottius varieornatus]|uniref:Transposase Tc5 C-terminal domain-containing protein n=1 Tax=Ramazzottius varieornatus TaxID=947166 RepID=A0A1D1UQ82_RAMVA|nr:hypothetical protein RvY_02957 [Ramazzottius varieornatus]
MSLIYSLLILGRRFLTEAADEVKPEELEYEMITIPPKVTGQIQPLNVLCFRTYKGYFRKVSNWIFLNIQPVQVHHRDVILKMHSLIYQQFTSPRFSNLIARAWHLSGYVDRSVEYVNLTEFCFQGLTGRCDHDKCERSLLLKCGWCKAPLCFYEEYHFCKIYLP